MPHIEQLSPHIANLIAAGEVVERPASVAKELLENAIDAGAKNVTVELQNGGMTYLRVTDDGCGIAPDELPTAFLRHATSKLHTAADLAAIGTLGFRGEALAAIASVSHLDIFSRQTGAQSGATLHLDGGKPLAVESAGCPEGTSVIVRNLFYNTPARLKFMKQDRAEATAIAGLVAHIALSHPDISFRLLKDGKEELHTPGDGKQISAVYAALGRDFALALLEVHGRDGALGADGFVTKPLAGRGTRGMQTFFVNGRFIKSQLLTAAVEEAYANRIMKGKFPGCVLNVTLPADLVDVNVHPAKTVVKFLDEKQVFQLVYHAVMDALDRDGAPEPLHTQPKPVQSAAPQEFYRNMSAQAFRARKEEKKPDAPASGLPASGRGEAACTPAQKRETPFLAVSPAASEMGGQIRVSDYSRRIPPDARRGGPEDGHVLPKMVEEIFLPQRTEAGAALPDVSESVKNTAVRETPSAPAETALPVAAREMSEVPAEPEQTAIEPEPVIPWRIAGEVLDTYIVCEDAEKNVWLIDKHAAHERVNFDRLKANLEPIMSQRLLTPAVAQLAAAEYTAVVGQFALLREFGFECEEFGDGAILIRALPADIAAEDAVASLEDLAGRLVETHHADPESARDALLHTMACKAAIKGGWKSDTAELRALVDKVQSGEVKFCPHGRPVAAKLTKYELEKMFKRA